MKKLLAIFVVLFACSSSARACPMCKDSASNSQAASGPLHDAYSSNGENISGGLNTSIYVMFASLLGVGGIISTVMVRGMRSSNRANADSNRRD